jgi:hypothetical protein
MVNRGERKKISPASLPLEWEFLHMTKWWEEEVEREMRWASARTRKSAVTPLTFLARERVFSKSPPGAAID